MSTVPVHMVTEAAAAAVDSPSSSVSHRMASPPLPSPLPPLPLAGRVAIVTGASRGIGRGIVLHLSSLGARLVLNYSTNSALADQLAAEINASSPNSAVPVQADVSDPSAAKALFDAAEASFGSPVHILVHNAAIVDPNYPSLAATPLADFDRVFAVNARGAFLCLREAANRVARGGGGRIVALSSSLVGSLMPGYGAYTASKAAVEAMVRTMAKELRGTGITANCVAPGAVATDMLFAGKSEEAVRIEAELPPFGRLGETRDIAPVVGFLCRDEAEWVNGQVIRANGGYV
ncbi:short-chain type dehydrogenase/reductase-like [Iris pallida]|uniref:Noroxomaritidine/norcraugsodine reductase n=1 Tax=Iris pallida TaxID=29817 RepID=A0AAX6E151_IRIPA|nr:short-chain type dehydrogenase/reductase-like [Iris pallida]